MNTEKKNLYPSVCVDADNQVFMIWLVRICAAGVIPAILVALIMGMSWGDPLNEWVQRYPEWFTAMLFIEFGFIMAVRDLGKLPKSAHGMSRQEEQATQIVWYLRRFLSRKFEDRMLRRRQHLQIANTEVLGYFAQLACSQRHESQVTCGITGNVLAAVKADIAVERARIFTSLSYWQYKAQSEEYALDMYKYELAALYQEVDKLWPYLVSYHAVRAASHYPTKAQEVLEAEIEKRLAVIPFLRAEKRPASNTVLAPSIVRPATLQG